MSEEKKPEQEKPNLKLDLKDVIMNDNKTLAIVRLDRIVMTGYAQIESEKVKEMLTLQALDLVSSTTSFKPELLKDAKVIVKVLGGNFPYDCEFWHAVDFPLIIVYGDAAILVAPRFEL